MVNAHWLIPALTGLGFIFIALSYTRIINLITNLAPLSAAVDNAVAVSAQAVAALAASGTNQDAEVAALAGRLQTAVDALSAAMVAPAPVEAVVA